MELARFFYKNDDLIHSLYAQIYSGLVASVETTRASGKTSEERVTGSAGASTTMFLLNGKGDVSTSINTETSQKDERKESISPHDAAVLDVIEALRPSMKQDVEASVFGDILYLKGQFVFIPRDLVKQGMELLLKINKQAIEHATQSCPREQRKHYKAFLDSALNAQAALDECRFFFISENNQRCSGFLHPSGMTESQMSLFFKHGTHAIPAHMIAIMEKTDTDVMPDMGKNNLLTSLNAFSSTAVQLWNSNMPVSYPVQPIVIFTPLNTDGIDGEEGAA